MDKTAPRYDEPIAARMIACQAAEREVSQRWRRRVRIVVEAVAIIACGYVACVIYSYLGGR